jgi:peptidoglycan/LPS O-acetylase OafA/YrhL
MNQKSGPEASTSTSSEEIYCISYLRGLAALGVVLYHVRIDLWVGFNAVMGGPQIGGAFDKMIAWLSLPTIFMGSGVMLFFVISGFCIHAPYAGPRGKKLDLGEYAVRRLFRIYPPYLAAILFAFGVQAIGYREGFLVSLDGYDYAMAVPMLQNSFAIQPECNPALWTIPIEVAFYIFFPLVYFGLKRASFTTLAAGLIVSLLAMASSLWAPIQSSFLPYWFTWIAGAALAEHYRKGDLQPPPPGILLLGTLALGLGLFCTWHTRVDAMIPGADIYAGVVNLSESFGYGIAFSVLLWWSLLNQRFYDLLPRTAHRALMFLGTISYSLYLFHTPLFRLCGWAWTFSFGEKPVDYLMTFPFVFLAIGLAWLAYLVVEAPAHVAGRKLAARIKGLRAPRAHDRAIGSTARNV